MGQLGDHILAFVVSTIAAGAIQQALMIAVLDAHGPQSALIPLFGVVLAISVVFGLTRRWTKSLPAIDRVAAALLALLAAIGLAALAFGNANYSPGVGGNIMWGLAVLLDLCFLLPGAVAVVIHWWLLRRGLAGA